MASYLRKPLPNPYTQGGNALTSYYMRRVKPTPPPKPRVVVKPPVTPEAPFDPRAQAEKDVQSIIDAMLAQVQSEQDAARKQAEAEAQFEIQKGQALAQGLQQLGISGAIQGIFQGAGNNQASLAQGFSGALRDEAAANAAAQQHLLSGTGQEGAVRNEGANMGNVTYGLGGYIPGTALNTQGAAFGAQAALQPGFALQFGGINSANRRADYTQNELPDFLKQRLDIIAQRPSLMQDLLQNNRSYADTLYQRKQDAAKVKQDRIDRQYEAAALKLAYGYKLSPREKRLINTYGMTPEAVEAAGKAKEARAEDARQRAAQAARDRATAARQEAADKRRAMLEAQKAAARSKLEKDKAAYRRALEEYKAAQRRALEAQKAANKAKAAAKKKTVGNAGDSAEASSGSSSKPPGLG